MDMNRKPSLFKIALACMIGNSLEIYDFAIFGMLAPIIGKLFFPTEDPIAQLLSTFAVFAIGFVMRPLGGVLFGHIGDRFGRSKALIYSFLLMAGPTMLIGLLPTYEMIGVAAPLLLIILRLLQGISLGGEYVGALAYMLEHAPPNQRMFYVAWPFNGGAFGMLLATLVGAAVTYQFSNEALLGGAWRLPFLLGAVPAFVGYFLRRHLRESPEFLEIAEMGHIPQLPLWEAVKNHWHKIVAFAASIIPFTVCNYIMFIFLPSFLKVERGFTYADVFSINIIPLILIIIINPFVGMLADKIGWTRQYVVGSIALMLIAFPLFQLFAVGSFWTIISVQILLVLILLLGGVMVAGVLMDLFPTNIRYTSSAIAYNIATSIFGGLTPFIGTLLMAEFGPTGPGYWLFASTVIGFAGGLAILKIIRPGIIDE